MNSKLKNFAIAWGVCFIIFNAITFIVPNELFNITRFDKPIFWISYACVNIVFISFLFIAIKFLKGEENIKFLNIPLIVTSYICVVVSLVIGSLFIVFPILPTWIGAIICILVLGYFVIACIKANSVKDIVEKVDEKIKQKTQFIKMAIVDIDNIYNRIVTDDIKESVKKVQEALRYSDPMSCSALESIEFEIDIKLQKLKGAVIKNEQNVVNDVVVELLILIQERNNKCKALK